MSEPEQFDLKAYVLMAKNGNLMEGYRVSLIRELDTEQYPLLHKMGFRASFNSHDGWIVIHPEAGPFGYYVPKTFNGIEVLGEL